MLILHISKDDSRIRWCHQHQYITNATDNYLDDFRQTGPSPGNSPATDWLNPVLTTQDANRSHAQPPANQVIV